MNGVDRATGRPLSGLDHILQSVGDILATPIGARVMRRDYGSLVPELIDQPMNGAGRLRLFAAVALALLRWEPRVRLKRVAIAAASPAEAAAGRFDLDLTLELPGAQAGGDARLTVPLRRQLPGVAAAFA